MSEHHDESEVIELVRAHDSRGFDMLVDMYGPMLFRYTRRMCQDHTDAEDALQETFLAAQEKIDQFRGDGKIRNWLFSIAGNACRQNLRRRQGKLKSELSFDDVQVSRDDAAGYDLSPWEQNPAEQALSSELAGRLEEAIAKIPETNRSTLILRDVEGLSTRETAEALDISEEAVKTRLHRARNFVRNHLKDYFEGKS